MRRFIKGAFQIDFPIGRKGRGLDLFGDPVGMRASGAGQPVDEALGPYVWSLRRIS